MFGWCRVLRVVWVCSLFSLVFAQTSVLRGELRCQPPSVRIDRPERSQQLLISVPRPDGNWSDVSRRVKFEVLPSNLASVDSQGLVRPLTEGKGELVIRLDAQTLRVPLEI